MSHPARGPKRSLGIDGKASAPWRRPPLSSMPSRLSEARMSHPARGPKRSLGIDDKASAPRRRPPQWSMPSRVSEAPA